MYIIETKQPTSKRWEREPIEFEDIDAASDYAEELYKEGLTVRVVDERYRQ